MFLEVQPHACDVGGLVTQVYIHPLYLGAYNGCVAVVQLLLDAKAAVDVSNRAGVTPLLAAAMMGHTNVVQLLLAAEASVNTARAKIITALHHAAIKGHTQWHSYCWPTMQT